MSHHAEYPQFSIDCARDIIRMVTGRTLRDELPLFAKCVYTLVGAGLGMTLGEPQESPHAFGAGDEPDVATLEQCREALRGVQEDGLPEGTFGAAGDEAEKLDPATIAMLIQLAMTLITKWIERRKNK